MKRRVELAFETTRNNPIAAKNVRAAQPRGRIGEYSESESEGNSFFLFLRAIENETYQSLYRRVPGITVAKFTIFPMFPRIIEFQAFRPGFGA
jgi:hypothetical protein